MLLLETAGFGDYRLPQLHHVVVSDHQPECGDTGLERAQCRRVRERR